MQFPLNFLIDKIINFGKEKGLCTLRLIFIYINWHIWDKLEVTPWKSIYFFSTKIFTFFFFPNITLIVLFIKKKKLILINEFLKLIAGSTAYFFKFFKYINYAKCSFTHLFLNVYILV